MSVATSLSVAQQYLTRYGMTSYVILGSIGCFFNICVFSQSTQRRSSCGLYILAMSFSGLCGLNISAVPVIWGLDYPSPFLYSQVSCGMFFYFRHSFNQMFRTFFVLVCADRYAACHQRANIRSFSRYKVALRVIPVVIIFWFLVPIVPTGFRALDNGICDVRSGTIEIIYTVYIISTSGVIPLITMIIFGILMIINLRETRRRIQPNSSSESGPNSLRRRDRDMMKMLLIELIICTITLAPNTITHIYKIVTVNVVKTKERQQIESFVYFLSRLFLLYLANTFSFWIYIATSQIFRQEELCRIDRLGLKRDIKDGKQDQSVLKTFVQPLQTELAKDVNVDIIELHDLITLRHALTQQKFRSVPEQKIFLDDLDEYQFSSKFPHLDLSKTMLSVLKGKTLKRFVN